MSSSIDITSMSKIVGYIKEHKNIVIYALLIIVLFQMSNRCSTKQNVEFERVTTNKTIDSLNSNISALKDTCNMLRLRVAELSSKSEQLSESNQLLKGAIERPIVIKNN